MGRGVILRVVSLVLMGAVITALRRTEQNATKITSGRVVVFGFIRVAARLGQMARAILLLTASV
jgi:hypothetical protein